jgi:hypothetical protein
MKTRLWRWNDIQKGEKGEEEKKIGEWKQWGGGGGGEGEGEDMEGERVEEEGEKKEEVEDKRLE